jgi:hypothetical protein
MPYNHKQYDAALDFMGAADENLSSSFWDQRRIAAYDLYEDIYRNATSTLRIVLRGDDQAPILVPNGRKICEATSRFLGKNVDYFVDNGGDESAREEVDNWFADWFKREKFVTKHNSNKLWGLIRGDAIWYLYANPDKVAGKRICVKELDPRQVFEIEDGDGDVIGIHIVELVQDFRDPDKPDKQIVRRRTFRKQPIGSDDGDDGATEGISSELTHWELGKWDDRTNEAKAKQEKVAYADKDEEEFMLPDTITQLPTYKWRNSAPQNSSWGTSQIAGLETLLYALNQSLSDEDATLVFQGLGMYVTNAAPPIDPDTGEVTSWNIGPKQIIEISGDQKFERVTGVSDLSPFINHMNYLDDHMAESCGVPQIAIGRVDVAVAESGISLQLQLMPLIAQNADKELELINVMDQMFHDITTMWLPGYEPEQFGNAEVMQDLNVVVLYDDPMPVDHTAKTNEIQLLDSSNLILKSMAVAELRKLGYKYPTTDADGNPLTDDDIAAMLLDQASAFAAASDPFSGAGAGTDANGNPVDANGNPIDPNNPQVDPSTNGQPNTPDSQTVSLGTS